MAVVTKATGIMGTAHGRGDFPFQNYIHAARQDTACPNHAYFIQCIYVSVSPITAHFTNQ